MAGGPTFMEMLGKIADDLGVIFQVNDTTSAISLIALIAMIVVSIISGKFFKTFFSLLGIVFLLFVLTCFSPILMWGVLGGAILWYVLARCKLPIKKILFWGAVCVGIGLALYNFFA